MQREGNKQCAIDVKNLGLKGRHISAVGETHGIEIWKFLEAPPG